MKKISLFFVFISFSGISQIKKVLFIGNSYTYVNNLPLMVSQVASSLGDSVYFDSSAPGGYTLSMHSTYAPTLTKIASQNWDYVIIQAQSQEPAFPPSQVETDTYPYADSLVKKVRENDSCSLVLFYMTWGRKYGDVANCPFYPVICTYEGMQYRLRQSYLEMAQLYGDEVAPVGSVWRELRHIDSTLNLYQADDSHPNVLGSYAAACTFYCSIFHKAIAGAFVPSGITMPEAILIQTTAQNIVFDSLNTWLIDTITHFTNFNFDYDSAGFLHLDAQVVGNDIYQWLVDGNYYYGQEVYIPLPITNSNVQLLCERNCVYDSTSSTVTTVFNDLNSNLTYKVFPNPIENILSITPSNYDEIRIYTIHGKNVSINKSKGQIDLSTLENGAYIISIIANNVCANYVILKQ